jgi:hypothetical protein
MIQTWYFLIHKFRTDERDMRRFQELSVAIGLRREPRLVDKTTTWPVCKLHDESRVELQVSPHRAG